MVHMSPLNHILMAAALLITALPCFHATNHGPQAHRFAEADSIFTSHACCCHSCSETPCPEEFEMPQKLSGFSITAVFPPTLIRLVSFAEPKCAVRPMFPEDAGMLASLQTVQLLI
jgi:hypothetical protein